VPWVQAFKTTLTKAVEAGELIDIEVNDDG
jgi:hypothetical protein